MRASHRALRIWSFGSALVARSVLAQAPAPPPPAAEAPAAPPSSSLSAGGLAPPPALEAAPAPGASPSSPAATEAELAKADKEDSGRGLEFVWLNGEVGVMHLGLGTFSNDQIVDQASVSTTQTGLVAGAGAGVRLLFVTLGARFRYAPLADLKLWTLGLEAGLHWQLGSLEPYLTLGAGYAQAGAMPGLDAPTLRGFDARFAVGLDYYLTNMFSIGVNAGPDLLILAREGSCTQPLTASGTVNPYCKSGSSTGGALTATALAGLHF